MSQIERRSLPVKNLELRQRGGVEVLMGTAIPFNQLSADLGGFVEQVDPAFVDRTLTSLGEGERMLALWNHDSSDTIGNTGPKGGLTVSKEKHGLDFQLQASNLTSKQRAAVERNDLNSMSFGFFVLKDEWKRGEDNKPDVRTLLDGTILEISPVTWPAYKTTSVTLAQRSHEEWRRSRPRRSPEWRRKALKAMEADVERDRHRQRTKPRPKPRRRAPAADDHDRVVLTGRQLADAVKEHRVEARRTVDHESAHCVTMIHEGVNVRSARLLWRKKWGKYIPAGGDVTTRGRSSSVTAASYVVGMIAEDRRGIGWNPARASGSDLAAVRRLTPGSHDMWHAREKARRVLRTFHRVFDEISYRLLREGELSGEECARIFEAERQRLKRLGRAA